MYFADKAQDSLEEALNIEVLLCTNVEDGKLEWASFWAKSKYFIFFILKTKTTPYLFLTFS